MNPMANMFSGNEKREIPTGLSQCTQASPVASNLWLWAKRLETLGKVLFWIIILIGVIETGVLISAANDAKAESGELFDVLFSQIVKYSLSAFIEYCSYHVLALLVGSLASIVQNSKISADVALLEANHHFPTEQTGSRNEKLKKLLEKGLITEEEYLQKTEGENE